MLHDPTNVGDGYKTVTEQFDHQWVIVIGVLVETNADDNVIDSPSDREYDTCLHFDHDFFILLLIPLDVEYP